MQVLLKECRKEGWLWGKGGGKRRKRGFPSPRLPVSNVQVPKFSLRSGGPLGTGESGMGTLRQYPPESHSPTHFPLPLLRFPSLPPPSPPLSIFLQLRLICMSLLGSAGHTPGTAPTVAAASPLTLGTRKPGRRDRGVGWFAKRSERETWGPLAALRSPPPGWTERLSGPDSEIQLGLLCSGRTPELGARSRPR